MSVISGRVEALSRDGTWKRLGDTQGVAAEATLRTNVNGVAVLSLPTGTLVLGKGSEVSITEAGATLNSGEVTLDRPTTMGRGAFALTCGEQSVSVEHGCTIVARKRHSFLVRHAVGFVTVGATPQAQVALEPGQELEVEFGKQPGSPKTSRWYLPDWSGEARAAWVLASIDTALVARAWEPGERQFVDRNLSTDLERVMRYPVESDAMVGFLVKAVGNAALGGRDLCRVVSEVESSFLEESEFTAADVLRYAGVAVVKAASFSEWQGGFKQLLHPPAPRPASGPDCPDDDKNRRPGTPRRDRRFPEGKDLPPPSDVPGVAG